jgi:hypothetical protein
MLAGFLPVLLTLVFCIVQSLSVYQLWRAQSCSTWLSNKLGVDVQVAAVESLTPNRYVLHGVRLTHPESRISLGRVRSVEVTQTMGTWKLQLMAPEIDGRQLMVAWQLVHDWFVCRPHAYTPVTKIVCNQLEVLNLGAGDQSLRNLTVEIFPKADVSDVLAKFCMEGDADNCNPTVLKIHRQHTEEQLETFLKMQTGTTAIPASLLEPLLSQVESFGIAAAFHGDLELTQRPDSWKVKTKFHLEAKGSAETPTHISISRNHVGQQWTTELTVASNLPLPCTLVRSLLPQVEAFGDQSTFRGASLHVIQQGTAWRANLEDVWLTSIDFTSLTSSMETPVVGQGFLWLKQAEIGSAGLNEAKGAIGIGQGRLEVTTLEAGKRLLGIELPRPPQSAVGSLPFEQIKAAFALNRTGLSLQGEVEPTYNTLIADAVGTLAVKKNSNVIPIQNLYELLRYRPPVITASAAVDAQHPR